MNRRRNGGRNGLGRPTRPGTNGWSADARRLLGLLNALGSTTFRPLLWQKASALDLTYAQSQVLLYVEQHPECHMGEVARAFRVTLPAATHIVDRLEQKGLVRRGADPGDRRVCVLDLTLAGHALVSDLEGLQLGALERVLTRLSPAARQRVLVGLRTLVSVGGEGRDRVAVVAYRTGQRGRGRRPARAIRRGAISATWA